MLLQIFETQHVLLGKVPRIVVSLPNTAQRKYSAHYNVDTQPQIISFHLYLLFNSLYPLFIQNILFIKIELSIVHI